MNKEIRKFNTILEKELNEKLGGIRDEYIEVIMGKYNTELIVINPKSKADPQIYRDEFEERLIEFEYFEREGSQLKFRLPTMDTFNFGGKLGIIKHILEGTVGIYVEVSAEDYEKMFGKRVYTRDPLDATVPKKELIYLMRYNSIVKNAERVTFERNNYLIRYPFSNKPPFPLFEEGAEFVEGIMDMIVKKAAGDTVKKFKKTA